MQALFPKTPKIDKFINFMANFSNFLNQMLIFDQLISLLTDERSKISTKLSTKTIKLAAQDNIFRPQFPIGEFHTTEHLFEV